MTLALRPYRAADQAACAAVFHRAVREGAARFYDAAQREAWAPAGSGADHAAPDRLLAQWCVVAERDGRVAGFMSLTPRGYLDMAFVLPEEMGRGTAAALHDALLARARAAGLARLTTHASHLARRFFARQGWRVDAAETVAMRGQRLDRFAMSRDLREGADVPA